MVKLRRRFCARAGRAAGRWSDGGLQRVVRRDARRKSRQSFGFPAGPQGPHAGAGCRRCGGLRQRLTKSGDANICGPLVKVTRSAVALCTSHHSRTPSPGSRRRPKMNKMSLRPHPEEHRERCVSKDGGESVRAAILRDARLRRAPQDEAGRWSVHSWALSDAPATRHQARSMLLKPA